MSIILTNLEVIGDIISFGSGASKQAIIGTAASGLV